MAKQAADRRVLGRGEGLPTAAMAAASALRAPMAGCPTEASRWERRTEKVGLHRSISVKYSSSGHVGTGVGHDPVTSSFAVA
jgi:hypothetical protein